MRKILCILPLCTNPKNIMSIKGNNRIVQYINGLNKFFEYSDILKSNNIDIYLIDNSTNTFSVEILNILPKNELNIYTMSIDRNIYGKVNKGAGLIDMWIYMKDIISKYDFLIHFEPRQLLIDFSFINTFLSTHRNLLKSYEKSVYTGILCIECKILMDYINNVNLDNMIHRSISIEYDLFNFMKKKRVKFDTIDKMNLIWFPYMEKETIL